ncbi:hypothetical protein V7S43_003476 [Phytophthora oleae]|uniref:Myosin motor domain-containing protein n=1 Tax=Phytophthora oleae TaxID=2107226 RepID=A0ABD3G0X7_9STRA
MELARQRRRHRKAAVAIQRCYRSHHKLVLRQQRAAVMLQGASKRFMHRLRCWQARLTIQRAVRCFLWRMRWQRYRKRIRKLLAAATRQQQLVAATETFKRVRETVLLQRQADTWVSHPERMQMLLRTRQRKQKLQVSPGLPLLKSTASRSVPAISSNKATRPQQHNLPSVYPSSRGE